MNQCDGCLMHHEVNKWGNHINSEGRPYMSCQAFMYEEKEQRLEEKENQCQQ